MSDGIKALPKLILLSAGGTGGHLFPADALAQDLISRGYRVALATDIRGKRFEPFAGGIPVYVLNSGTIGAGIMKKIKSAFSLGMGFFQARKLLADLKPAVVVGFGGYPSVPGIYAAQTMKIPTIIHEQNAVLGRANVFLAPKAEKIAVAWAHIEGLDNADENRAIVTGNPVRSDIAGLYNKPYPTIEQDGPLRIFITGGSQGASVFSEIMPEALARLPAHHRERLDIVQQCREEDVERVKSIYDAAKIKSDLRPFFKDMALQLERCHLFIGRSGAGTVSEVTTAGRPAIFVPYPHHADQQQKRNADAVADAGGAWVMTQNGFTPEALLARLETFLQNPETLFRAAENARSCGRPDAARKLGNIVMAIASGWDKHPQG
ncbi:MAG: undecaprenyldiphospho-muramoylpentapeptide beta-N-acetylglucosaminyltransferase [Micavibrio aeruginosavorus]|uniref:UDP-N-acetylglucosamine--N-acetylmuramyl-(pentapeptide) pyrophosphoryl-undecaprenol N-acetylglucosamine transferase n=1 Tax=Micavibrio aeruginosavorus TaxID=349221 RepID=A0A2W4ZTM2_9BACT|nr:MAG: undecaprenyldiphospho-muramoylpentapeptide beta-N-acetylglucosaminyltransferase [Micavibrio aeruginosavorus]